MKPTTAATRVDRARSHVTLLEGLVELMRRANDDGETAIHAPKSTVLLEARRQIGNLSEEVAWLEEVDRELRAVPAPDDDERQAAKT